MVYYQLYECCIEIREIGRANISLSPLSLHSLYLSLFHVCSLLSYLVSLALADWEGREAINRRAARDVHLGQGPRVGRGRMEVAVAEVQP